MEKIKNDMAGDSGPNLPQRNTPPIVSADWLAKESDNSQLVIIDLRNPEEYSAGHIPMSINIPAASFVVTRNELLLEIPDEEDLFKIIGSAGISKDSVVIVVNSASGTYPLADTTRAAYTLIYAGVRNTCVLSGGIEKWKADKKPFNIEDITPKAVAYNSEIYPGMVVDKEYVEERIGKALIVDARDPDVYFGVSIEPFAPRPGHIPTAVNLPAPWLWTAEGLYKETTELAKMVEGVAGTDKSREIIVYCGVGGYGSTAWFVQHEVLGYINVKLFDGSAQQWASDPGTEFSTYVWD